MAKLYFDIGANYQQVSELTQRLRELERQMIQTDMAADAEGLKKLEKEYSKLSGDIQLLVTQAAKSGADVDKLLGSLSAGLAQTLSDMSDNIQKGVDVTGQEMLEAFTAMSDEVETALKIIDEYSTGVAAALQENSKEISRLKKLQADTTNDIPEIEDKIVKLEEEDARYRDMQKTLADYKKDIRDEADLIDESVEKYDALAKKQAELIAQKEESEKNGAGVSGELTDEMVSIESEMQNVVGTFLSSGASLQQKISSLTGPLTRLGAQFLQSKLSATSAAGGMNVFQMASQKAGVALVKMGMSAKGAKLALAGFAAVLPTAAVTLLIGAVVKLIQKFKEQKEAALAQIEQFKSVSEAILDNVFSFYSLQQEWQGLRTEMEKSQFLTDRKKDLEKLGLAVNDVTTAEDVLINNTETYIDAQLKRAEADAYLEKVRAKLSEALTKRQERDATDDRQTVKVFQGIDPVTGMATYGRVSKKDVLDKEYQKLKQEAEDLSKQAYDTLHQSRGLMDSLNPVGPKMPDGSTIEDEIAKRKKAYEDAQAWLETVQKNQDKYSVKQLEAAKKNASDTKKAYEDLTGTTTTTRSSGRKAIKEQEDERENLYRSFGKEITSFVKSVEEDITDATIEGMEEGDEKILAQQRRRKEKLLKGAQEAGAAMQSLYNGNVDLLNRPLIDAAKLSEKGWGDAGEGIATVFSSLYDHAKGDVLRDSSGKAHKVLVTPILPDGSVLSPEELNDYVDNVLYGANDILEADKKGKGIVIAVDVPDDGERLHLMQEQFYDMIALVEKYTELLNNADANKRIAESRKAEEDNVKSLLENYKSLEDRKMEVEDSYLNDSIELQLKYEETGDEIYLRTLEERTRAYKESLKEIEGATDSTLKLIFGDIDLMSKSTLDSAIEAAKERLTELLKDPTASTSDISAMRSQLDNLTSARTNYDFKGWGGSLADLLGLKSRKESLTKQKDSDNEALKNLDKSSKKYQELAEDIGTTEEQLKELEKEQAKAAAAFAASELGKNLEKIGSALKQIGDLTEDDTMSSLGEGFSEVGGVVSNIANGFATGGLWGGIAAAAGTVVDKVMEAVVSAKVADAEFKKMTSDFESRLQMLSLKSKDYSNIFGVDSIKETREAYTNAAKALGSFVAESNRLRGESFKSKDFSWWSNLFGKDDEYSSLRDFDIWGEDGLLNPDKAREFLSVWGDKLSESQKTQINHALELKDAYDELTDTVKNYVGSLTGETAADLAGDMVDKFIRTGSAILDMSDNMDSFKRKLAEAQVESLLMENVFTKEAQDNISSLLMNKDVTGAIEAYNALLDEANGMSGEIETFLSGINVQNIENQAATGGGFQVMSQDTGTELNGRFTALQISGENIEASMNDIAENFMAFSERFYSQFIAIDDIRNIQAQSLIELQGINENTLLALKPIREMNATLGLIKTKVDKL